MSQIIYLKLSSCYQSNMITLQYDFVDHKPMKSTNLKYVIISYSNVYP